MQTLHKCMIKESILNLECKNFSLIGWATCLIAWNDATEYISSVNTGSKKHRPERFDDKRGHGRHSSEAGLPRQRHAVLGDVGDLRFGRRTRELVLVMAFGDHHAAWFYTNGKVRRKQRKVRRECNTPTPINATVETAVHLWPPGRHSRMSRHWSWWPHMCRSPSLTAEKHERAHVFKDTDIIIAALMDRHNVIYSPQTELSATLWLLTHPESSSGSSSSNRKLRLLLPVAATLNVCEATVGSGLLRGAKLRVICECLKVLTLIS